MLFKIVNIWTMHAKYMYWEYLSLPFVNSAICETDVWMYKMINSKVTVEVLFFLVKFFCVSLHLILKNVYLWFIIVKVYLFKLQSNINIVELHSMCWSVMQNVYISYLLWRLSFHISEVGNIQTYCKTVVIWDKLKAFHL